jgi:hypothetical protein
MVHYKQRLLHDIIFNLLIKPILRLFKLVIGLIAPGLKQKDQDYR